MCLVVNKKEITIYECDRCGLKHQSEKGGPYDWARIELRFSISDWRYSEGRWTNDKNLCPECLTDILNVYNSPSKKRDGITIIEDQQEKQKER